MSAQAAAQAAGQFLPTGDLGNKTKSAVYIAIVVLVIVIVIIAIKRGGDIFKSITDMVNKPLEFFGLKDSAEDTKADADLAAVDSKANSITSPFNPTFYKTAPAGTPLFTQAKADALADQVYDSVGVIYDDPEDGLAAVKQAKNWAMVSQIADSLARQYDKDMYGWLKIKYDRTSQKDILAKMVNYAFNLPKY